MNVSVLSSSDWFDEALIEMALYMNRNIAHTMRSMSSLLCMDHNGGHKQIFQFIESKLLSECVKEIRYFDNNKIQ